MVDYPARKYLTGALVDTPDERDYIYPASAPATSGSYRTQYLPTVINQKVSNCVNCAISYAYEMFYGTPVYSKGFIYGYRPADYYRGEGMLMREGLKTANKIGNLSYKDYPYEHEVPKAYQNLLPHINKYKSKAAPYKIKAYYRCDSSSTINAALKNGHKVIFSARISSFDTDRRGVFDCSKPAYFGYHAMCVVDYDFTGAYPAPYRVVNSWGETFGNQGYCYMSAEDVLSVRDVWAIEFVGSKTVEPKPAPKPSPVNPYPKTSAYVVFTPVGTENALKKLKVQFVEKEYANGRYLSIKEYPHTLAGLASAKAYGLNLKRKGLPIKILDVK